MSCQIIAANGAVGSVERLCGAIGVSVSGYCAWQGRLPSQGQQEDERRLSHIRGAYQVGRGLYGSPRIHAALCQQGIHSRRHPKRRVWTSDRRHNRPVAPNRLACDFSADEPNEKWLDDIVGIWTDEAVSGRFVGHLLTLHCGLGHEPLPG